MYVAGVRDRCAVCLFQFREGTHSDIVGNSRVEVAKLCVGLALLKKMHDCEKEPYRL